LPSTHDPLRARDDPPRNARQMLSRPPRQTALSCLARLTETTTETERSETYEKPAVSPETASEAKPSTVSPSRLFPLRGKAGETEGRDETPHTKDKRMREVEYDCPECRRRGAIGKLLVDALRGAIDAREEADVEAQEIEAAAWRAREERHDELCRKLTPAIIKALAPLSAQMREGEPINIRVGDKISLTLRQTGAAPPRRRRRSVLTLGAWDAKACAPRRPQRTGRTVF
jgi:hypothetical protein